MARPRRAHPHQGSLPGVVDGEGMGDLPPPPPPPPAGSVRIGERTVHVAVTRSDRRRRTVQARLVGDVLAVAAPARIRAADLDRAIADLVARMDRRARLDRFDLARRATALAERHGFPAPTSVRWADMATRWGSCTTRDGTIRVSSALGAFPDWVLDYVLVHELAHLVVADHSDAFWALVARYPLAERARGYLHAKGDGL